MSAPWRETPNVEWTDERPTEPGDYWLSLCPDKRRPGADVERITVSSVERRQIANTARPGWTCIDSGKPSQALSVVSFDDDLFTNYFDLRASAFDGALWAPRETPADPFAKQETMIRTIKGPCFDCDVRSCWCGWGDNDECACHSPMGERTAPIIKIEPDELRPNVPPRMM